VLSLHQEHHVPTPERRATQAGLHLNDRLSAPWVDPSISHGCIGTYIKGLSAPLVNNSALQVSSNARLSPESYGFERSGSAVFPARCSVTKLNHSNSPSTCFFSGCWIILRSAFAHCPSPFVLPELSPSGRDCMSIFSYRAPFLPSLSLHFFFQLQDSIPSGLSLQALLCLVIPWSSMWKLPFRTPLGL
jgi:hypothetical protein